MKTFITIKNSSGTSWNFIGDSDAEKIGCCLLLPFSAPHEMGHYLAAKYYGYDVPEVEFSCKGGRTCSRKTFSINEEKKWQHQSAMISMAGPIFSVAFHNLGLLRLLAKKNSIHPPRIMIYIHYSAIHGELAYARRSSSDQDDGDWGILRKKYPEYHKIGALCLAMLTGISSLACIRLLKKYPLYTTKKS